MEAAARIQSRSTGPTYIRRQPEKTALYQVLQQHLLTFEQQWTDEAPGPGEIWHLGPGWSARSAGHFARSMEAFAPWMTRNQGFPDQEDHASNCQGTFTMRTRMVYPSAQDEREMLLSSPPVVDVAIANLPPALSLAEVRQMQEAAGHVRLAPELAAYIVEVARETRRSPFLALGISPAAHQPKSEPPVFQLYSNTLDRLSARGFSLLPHETPHEFLLPTRSTSITCAEALAHLTEWYTQARYGETEVPDEIMTRLRS